ncbi:MAG: right-handed parallel beta-helix repeat-containing protein [Pedosphaera sp.]|nr:right-handed parallel beta-helix repeat-containing protein [Pedosphaera sp.]
MIQSCLHNELRWYHCVERLWLGLLFVSLFQIHTFADFYIAHVGSDTNLGTKSKPFATLERARDAVRELKRAGKLPKRGLTVWLRGGDYVRTNALELTDADSGNAAAPIVWRAYRDERVRLLGGRVLTGFTPVSNPAVLARLDEKARGRIVQCDLRRLDISEFGEMKSRGFGRATTPSHSELFHDSKPMPLARWPNEGNFEKLAGFPEAAGKGDDHGGKIGDLHGGFLFSSDRPKRWYDTQDLWVHGYWAWDWANSYEHVTALDTTTGLIQTAPPHGLYGFRKGQRFYFLNVLEELDQPGEWFLDRSSSVIYFWPPTPLATVLAPRSSNEIPIPETILSLLDQPLLKLTSASHIAFQGLTLEATRGNAIEIRGGESNRIAGCLIRNIGNNGVVIEGGRGHGVISCDIFDTGDGGVTLNGGDRQTLTPGSHFVENCHFQRQGRWSKCYVPAVLMGGVGMRVSHNLIHDHPHCAILFTGNDHLIEFNDIHHIALETGDVGAIYTGRDYSFRGNKIRHNFIHETGGVGMGSMGVYMDDCVSGTEVYGNIFYKVHWAMFIGGGRDHHVENNIFVDCDPAVRADGRGLDKSPVWRGMVDDYMRKQLHAVPLDLYRRRYPEMKSLDRYYGPLDGPAIEGASFTGIPPEGNLIARNIAVGKWLEAGWNTKKENLELRDNLTGEDPEFVATYATDFRLRKGSRAWKLGFQRIPVEKIGIQPDSHRRSPLPTAFPKR